MTGRRKDSTGRVLKDGEYQRKNGTYEYRYRSKTGKSHSIYAPTLQALREKEKDIAKATLSGLDASARSLRIDDLFDKWRRLKIGLKDNTLQNYIYMYQQYVQGGFGRCKVLDVRKSDIREYYTTLYDERGLRPSTIDGVHTVLHQVLQLAVDDDMIPSNPADGAAKDLKKAHAADAQKRMALTEVQELTVLRYVRDHAVYAHWYPLLVTLLFTGLRIGELAGLTWDDVDLQAGVMHIRHTLVYYDKLAEKSEKKCIYKMNSPKTRTSYRDVPILPIVHTALLAERQYLQDAHITPAVDVDGYKNFIFLNRQGLPMQNGIVNKAIRRIVRDCNYALMDKQNTAGLIPYFSCHSCRHTCATRMNEYGINEKCRRDILGHTCDDITNRVYTDTFGDFRAAEMAKLNALAEKI